MRQFNPNGRSHIGIGGSLDGRKEVAAEDQLYIMMDKLIYKNPERTAYCLSSFRKSPRFVHVVVRLQEMDFQRVADRLMGHPVLVDRGMRISYDVLPNGEDAFIIEPACYERPIIDLELPEPA